MFVLVIVLIIYLQYYYCVLIYIIAEVNAAPFLQRLLPVSREFGGSDVDIMKYCSGGSGSSSEYPHLSKWITAVCERESVKQTSMSDDTIVTNMKKFQSRFFTPPKTTTTTASK